MSAPLPPPPPTTTNMPPPANSEPEVVENHVEDTPTVSHALAEQSITDPVDTAAAAAAPPPSSTAHPAEKTSVIGASQEPHDDLEVRDLGWNEANRAAAPRPVVAGITNDNLWLLIRRFDKHVFHVRSIQEPPLDQLDMNIADDEEFSPEKLRAQLERFYMSVLVSLFAAWKHVARLRSWRESRRTSAFLAGYALAWLLNMLLPACFGFLIVLIVYPPSREYCFPPAPPSLIDAKTGGVKKPAAGVLASDDSVTGAPEKHQGEAVELEARSFVNSLSSVLSGLVVSSAVGQPPQGDPENPKKTTPQPIDITTDVTDAHDTTMGTETAVEHNRAKAPVSHAVWAKARPLMHMLADVVDTWERMGNALSATPPFPQERPRLVLASVFMPMFLGSCFLTSYMMMKFTGFAVGFSFFGDPIITPLMALLNRTYPKWQKYVELRNTILRGVPTNAQVAITLLRIGERNAAPVPPPPGPTPGPPPVQPHTTAGQGLEHLGASPEEIDNAVQPLPEEQLVNTDGIGAKSKHKKGHRIINLIKGTAKGGIHTLLTADKAKAKAGAHHARDRLGVVHSGPMPETGPVSFPCRYKGRKGHAFITLTATTPALSWTSNMDEMDPAWTVAIGDIDELKKIGGLGWKSKIVVGWALEKEIIDGLLVVAKTGEQYHLTAVSMRDELFNRLIAIGSQMWEAW